jgi:hypothetical protein
MATISKSGIADGSTARAEHITRIIDALDGTAATEIIATGSFTGSFTGDGSGLTGVGAGGDGIFAQTGSYYATTNDLQITGSLTVTSIINGSTRTTQDSIVVTNSSAFLGHPSGSGIYPGMIGNIDLNPSTTNAIRYVLGPLTEYTSGDRYEFQIVNYNGTSEEFRIEVNALTDTNKMNAQVFGADGTNVIQRNINTVRFGTGNSYSADRIIVTACKSGTGLLWNVQAHVSGGAGIVTA